MLLSNKYFQAWSAALQQRGFRWDLAVTVLCLVAVMTALSNFLPQIERRHGVAFDDPLLQLFLPFDLTWLTFAIIYLGLLVGVILLGREPRVLLVAAQSYAVMVVIRMGAMSLLPLDPPLTMIPLADPTAEYFGFGALLTKDLFFSGHTSTLFLLFLTAQTRRPRVLFLAGALIVAACVLAQHVHYAIDVFSAPFFAYGAFRLVVLGRRLLARRLYGVASV